MNRSKARITAIATVGGAVLARAPEELFRIGSRVCCADGGHGGTLVRNAARSAPAGG